MKAKTEFQTVKDAYLEQMKEQQEQISEVRTMSARDLGKKIDSLEDVHQDIRMSMIDTISDVSTRKKLESRLQKSYDQYFKVLAEIEKMLK
jgi:predicted secreted Zn-dependent protease